MDLKFIQSKPERVEANALYAGAEKRRKKFYYKIDDVVNLIMHSLSKSNLWKKELKLEA